MKSYVVDAFTNQIFKGNPAAVMFLDQFLAPQLMQKIAMENKLSETAFAVKQADDRYQLRWFTPGGEIDLCGHATLATGYLVFAKTPISSNRVIFETQSGDLTVTKKDNQYEMDFPTFDLKPVVVSDEMEAAFGIRPQEAYMGRDLLCVLPDENMVENLMPDMEKVRQLGGLLQHVTAKGTKFDCVSRSFGPKLGVPEDPVCGSGHCHIAPYWAKRLGQNRLDAYQASPRTGILHCEVAGDRVKISGEAVQYSESEVDLATARI